MNDAWLRHSALALAVSGLLHAPAASAQDIPVEAEFDRQMLISRGLAPELADLFRKAPQFTPGSHRVALQVNGRGRGSVDAQFSTSGELRATLALLRDARLHTPRSVADLGEDATFDLRQAWPQAVVRPQPGQQALHLVLPVEALDDANGTPDDWHQGGSAALLNYDVSSNTRVAAGRSQTSYTAFTEVGVNTGGWILRSRQSFSHSGSASHLQVVESFAQRSLVHRRQLLQIGELAVAGPLFGGALITGIQLLPEDALPAPEAGGVVVEGLANSEARVEVRQSGVLITFILPCLGRTEQDLQATGPQAVTVEDSMSMVHASRGKLKPASDLLRSEPAIVAGIASATLPSSTVRWSDMVADYDMIRDAIEAVFPEFSDYNARIRIPGGFRLPLPPTERVWPTASGKAEFIRFQGLAEDPTPIDSAVLKLATLRSHDQYNTTIYSLDDRYRGVFGRRDVVFMNEEDMSERGIQQGDQIRITTALDNEQSRVLENVIAIGYKISRGSVATYYPEGNCLIPLNYIDPVSGTPSYKSVPVHITLA